MGLATIKIIHPNTKEVIANIKDSITTNLFKERLNELESKLNKAKDVDAEVIAEENILLSKVNFENKNDELTQIYELLEDIEDIETLRKEVTSYSFFNLKYKEFYNYLSSIGYIPVQKPAYSYLNFEDLILEFYKKECDLIIYTDFNGEFVIPEGINRYFAFLDRDDDSWYWIESINVDTNEELIISNSSVTTTDPLDLLYND